MAPETTHRKPTAILFVCLGNICRSPSAQGICEAEISERGWQSRVVADSCGTAAFNLGKPPDERAQAAARRQGFDIAGQRARQITPQDYGRFQYIVAMDAMNLSSVRAWAPPDYAGEIALLLSYRGQQHGQVADPYYQQEDAFDGVIRELRQGVQALLDHIGHTHQFREMPP